ncbi:MAG: transglycosylase SLT domain-containing protein [Flavobacteriaceae bacterium]|nr:transglycosylase SLT domain-containing protein [Flavobacteriaceae bacterium]
MKKLILLNLLVFSPLLFSQNSFQSATVDYMNYPIFNQETSNTFYQRNLVILDKDYANIRNNHWLINPAQSANNKNEFSSLLLKKQLEALNHKTPFNISHNPTLERYIRVFLNDRKESIANLMDRASYYFPIFETYLDQYDLPLEIKYLAVIESALKPNANSPSGAKGLWQFMLPTGKQYDLEVNSYVDDRFDPIKSTEAACKYLTSLYQMFDDWDLALAAYNSGPGNVRKAIKRAGGKRNYWEIRQFLPQETRGYLPAFYATFYIFEYAESHSLKPTKSELTYFEVDTVHVQKELSFDRIQKNIPIKKELLISLNPQYKREVIPYSHSDKYVLTLPKSLIPAFIEKEDIIYKTHENPSRSLTNSIEISKNNSYVVKQGDNLNKIANMHHISLEQLKIWNGLQTDYLISGQRLVITDKSNIKNSLKKHVSNSEKPIVHITEPQTKKALNHPTGNFETYVVKEGDTLFNISRKYANISINQIRSWNNIKDVKYLKPGTKLKILKS